ncbi:disease resistance protein SUMM2-like isoform X2 [Actinidia eriantha]|nr:disease resistance protein SUMM2-like isoform X2 [Actinidia eriantha]XP_057474961.1 disease resistance protein SUMM2-like isoform X2 [Actinidia eriantha]
MAETLGNAVLEQLSSIYGFDENMQALRRKLEDLSCQETDMNTELENAELQSRNKRKREVENWLRNVEKKKCEIQGIEQELRERRIFSRVKYGKRVKRMIIEVEDLVQQGRFPEGLMIDACERIGDSLPTTRLVGQTSQRNLEEIWACLMNDEVLSIGIYGMGGVGKTTITMHIHNRIIDHVDSFQNVYWVTVSKEFSIHRLQNDIAKAVGREISHEGDEMRRAALLFKLLMKRKNSVLILDDMWDHFPLEKVGVPIRRTGCKLILTSRSLDVCHKMGCQEIIKVEPLSKEEAWMLFTEKLGHNNRLPPNVNEIAESVVDRCAGLPLGIITMAGNMIGVSDIHEWRNVLEELNESTRQGDMESSVFPILKLSYNHLGDSKLQLCFLYCALYPEDSYIDRKELIEYFIAEGLIDGRKSRQAEFDLGHSILNKLENACLLESVKGCRNDKCLKMHDLIREMALKLTKVNPRYMVKAGMQLRDLPDEQEWTVDLEKVSLMKNEISRIPSGTSPRCPRLSTLILRENPLERLPYSFVLHLHNLTVLDLSHTDIENLPSSISDLECLTALLLSRCEQLISVPSLAKLTELRVLDLGYTKIKRAPQGLESLVSLKSLNMQQTWNLEMMPTEKLSKLSSLQKLVLDYSSEHVRVQAEELMSLRHLEEFEGQLYDLYGFNRYVKSQHYKGLKVYRLQVRSGECQNRSAYIDFEDKYDKEVRLVNCSLVRKKGGRDPLLLPHDMQYLEIDECQIVAGCLLDVSSSLRNARELKACAIVHCDGIEYILPSSSSLSPSSNAPFQSLEKLDLHGLQNLSDLYKWGRGGATPTNGTFLNLKHLDISGCPSIRKLFTIHLLQNLHNLELIYVWECKQMEEIISLDNEEENETESMDESTTTSTSSSNQSSSSHGTVVSFPKLKRLSLQQLPELKSICGGVMACDSIQSIAVIRCPKLKTLSLSLLPSNEQQSPTPPLEEILIDDRQWWESLQWNHPNHKNVLQPLVRFW